MNERIVKLISEADSHARSIADKYAPDCGQVSYLWEDAFRKKFAELLIRECIMVCWPGGESDILYEQANAIDKAFIDGQDACVERLKQHFGVE
jgi:hypothetical protein